MNGPRHPLRAALFAAVVLATAFAAPGCESTGSGTPQARTGSDEPGTVLADAVRITSVDRSAMTKDGTVKYVVENASGNDEEDLVWSVSFVFPPGDREAEVAVAEEMETTDEKTLVLLRGTTGKELAAQCGAFAERRGRGQLPIGTRLNVAQNPPVLTMPRLADGTPGTRLASGRLECVAQSDVDDDPNQLVIEFENVSAAKVANLEVQAYFPYSKAKSKWKPIPATAPGARAKVTIDLRGLDLGDRAFLVKVQQQKL